MIQHVQELLQGLFVEVLRKTESVSSCLQRPYCFLESLLVCLPDAHHFTDSLHLRSEPVFQTFEFFKGPPRELDNNVIA